MASQRAIAPGPPSNPRRVVLTGPNRDHISLQPQRSQRVKTACQACRLSRSKCDGSRPTCQTCTAKRAVCQYEALPGQTRGAARKDLLDSVLADNLSMLEIFWHLRTTSTERAQEFLEFIKDEDGVSISSMKKWFQERHSGGRVTNDTIKASGEEAAFAGPIDSPNDESSRAQDWGHTVTIAEVRVAINVFFQCTGMLFYVFTKEQVHSILDDGLKEFQQTEETYFEDFLAKCMTAQHGTPLAELCGIAAAGVLYIRVSNQEYLLPAGLAEYFYSITKQMLESSIQSNPLRGMKICALLAIYNIILKANVALTYIELGLALGRLHELNISQCPLGIDKEDFLDYKRTWRSLLLFSGWLSASLGYVSWQASSNFHLLEDEQDLNDDDFIQRELVKVTITKAKIIHMTPDNDFNIEGIRRELNNFHQELPTWMSIGSVLDALHTAPFRRHIFYLHLFFLSALQLLHRRILENQVLSTGSQCAKAAVREGLMAAKMTARILALMHLEGAVVKLCWMCIFSSYTAAVIILHAAVQKILNGYPSSTWIADLTLVDICVQTLQFCAEVDEVAVRFKEVICRYLHIVQEAVDGKLKRDLFESNEEGESIEYLLVVPSGDTSLDKAGRDLLFFVQQPFSNPAKYISEGLPSLDLRRTLVNWVEATMEIPEEWKWELQCCNLRTSGEALNVQGVDSRILEVISQVPPGRFLSTVGKSLWTTWTPHPV